MNNGMDFNTGASSFVAHLNLWEALRRGNGPPPPWWVVVLLVLVGLAVGWWMYQL